MRKLVGQPLRRREDLRLLTGQGRFVDDFKCAGLHHAVVVRSPVAAGRIRSMDKSAALAAPGVVAVLVAADFSACTRPIPLRGGILPGLLDYLQPVIARDRVCYVGEPVALVVATSRALAEDAAEMLYPDIEATEPIVTFDAARAGRILVHPASGRNVAERWQSRRGDAAAAFTRAAYTRRESFRCHRHSSVPLETRGLVARWDAARAHLEVLGAAKVPHFNRDVLAGMLGLEPSQVDLVELDVGGSFGARGEFYPEDLLIPAAARITGLPIKWIEDRRENLLAMNHAREMECELEIAADADGRILGLRGRLVADMGAYVRTTGVIAAAKAGNFLPGPYDIPDYACDIEAVVTNRTPTGTYRGPGRYEANFFRERLIDLMAHDLGIDAAEVRRRNLVRREQMPYPIGSLVPYEGPASYDSGDYPAALARALDEIGHAALAAQRGRLVDGRYHGIGIGCFVDSTGPGPAEYARIRVRRPDAIDVFTGCSSSGQGHQTTFAQIAADVLGLPFEAVQVQACSTLGTKRGGGTFHGRGIVMGGNAVRTAAEALRSAWIALAAARSGLAAATLACEGGVVRATGPDGSAGPVLLDLPMLCSEAAAGDPSALSALEADMVYESRGCTFEYGTQVAHVAVDVETAQIEVLRLLTVEDCGNPVNPMIVHGQVIGASVQGLSGTLLEEFVYDRDGQMLSGTFADYLIATATEFPRVDAISVNLAPSSHNALGLKGVGEGGTEGVGAAVANAVADALRDFDLALTELPLSPDRLARALRESRRSRG
ncbi:MAG: xanthine dehydrogenase family protein molybdopterin-binding subunit [bacterium]|jgi:carbon-monoxide dehydrogenase large subunit|nr:xanthine dehydrogenase family protein [Rhodocyclaceae bacterium]MCA4904884.1 xanthine dehydrogenase family protein [Rhodocyclaceae bacterium]MCE2978422.1 xanthine dehydrogenase family protein molybdopterin-binding subunit [Betaproteobacteria bacterium]